MSAIKTTLRYLFPAAFARLDCYRNKRDLKHRDDMMRQYVQHFGLRVQGGPFAGMNVVPEMADGIALPQLVGSYEQELHGVIESLHGYRTIINVGAAYGYYTVGLALRFPEAAIHSYETDDGPRQVCQTLVDTNDVQDRVKLHGKCDLDTLRDIVPTEPCLVFCDCEGCEYDLLKPASVPLIKRADLIVEIHTPKDPKRAFGFVERFEQSHHVELFEFGDRDPKAYPTLSQFARRSRELAIREFRSRGLRWAFMTSKDRDRTISE